MTAGHLTSVRVDIMGINGSAIRVVIVALATGFVDCYPATGEGAEVGMLALQYFIGMGADGGFSHATAQRTSTAPPLTSDCAQALRDHTPINQIRWQ